jgi:dTDP-4-dehydrorhamnose reductase
MRILILGSHGQFGTSLEAACRDRRVDYYAATRKDADLTDSKAVQSLVAREMIGAIVNATTFGGIAECEADPDAAFAVNTTATLRLAEICAERDIPLVQTSTHLVFRGDNPEPYVERDLPAPNSVYSASKLASEHLAATRCPKHYVLRFPTLYGARRNNATGFVEKMIDLLRQDRPLRIADDRLDCPTWAYDAGQTLLDLLLDKADYGLYHTANSGAVTYYDFVCALRDVLGSASKVDRAKDADFPAYPPKPVKVAIRSTRMAPLRSWQDALAAYCAPATR